MANLDPVLVAEIGQASDITLLAFVLVVALVVGLGVAGIDALVARLHRRSGDRRH